MYPPELTHHNHFKFGFNGEKYNFRSGREDQWWVKYGACTKEPLNFRSECVRTAQTIRQKTSEPLWVLFSGGVDSEVVVQSFVSAKIHVQAAILRFKNDLNIHDISYAIIACEKLHVPYKIFDLDIADFWQRSAFDYATPTSCTSPQLLTTMYLADQVEGYPILGSGECLLVKDVPVSYIAGESPYLQSSWYLWEKEKIASWYRHFLVRKRNACPGFFQYTPEIMMSYLQDPFVQNLINDKITGKLSTESSKLAIYQQHFDLISRPKFSGFEKVQDLDFQVRKSLTNAFPYSNQVVKTSTDDLLAQLCVKSESELGLHAFTV